MQTSVHQGPGHDARSSPGLIHQQRRFAMGLLVTGEWRDRWYDTESTGGRFMREDAGFRHWVEDSAEAPFTPEADRYHLYVSLACPWAHRTLILRALKGLQAVIGVSVVDPYMGDHGWAF